MGPDARLLLDGRDQGAAPLRRHGRVDVRHRQPHARRSTAGACGTPSTASATTAIDATTGALGAAPASGACPPSARRLAFVSAGQGRHADARMLQAVDAATGAVRWEFGAEHGIHTTPTVAGGTVYVADIRRGLYGLRAGDGRLQWCTTMPTSRTARPTSWPARACCS